MSCPEQCLGPVFWVPFGALGPPCGVAGPAVAKGSLATADLSGVCCRLGRANMGYMREPGVLFC